MVQERKKDEGSTTTTTTKWHPVGDGVRAQGRCVIRHMGFVFFVDRGGEGACYFYLFQAIFFPPAPRRALQDANIKIFRSRRFFFYIHSTVIIPTNRHHHYHHHRRRRRRHYRCSGSVQRNGRRGGCDLGGGGRFGTMQYYYSIRYRVYIIQYHPIRIFRCAPLGKKRGKE